MTARDVTGARYGRLTAVRFVGSRRVGSQSKRFWLLRCDCGAEVERPYSAFASGTTSSCGCLLKQAITRHGGYMTPEYNVWHAMLERCRNPRNPAWDDYGGRGIAVCGRWQHFEAFRSDMGVRPPGGTLERIDVDGNYEPGNCRWASAQEQANNRRNNRVIAHAGAKRTLAEWARFAGISTSCLRHRLSSGWPMDAALAHSADRSASNVRTKGAAKR
jgi:hypothetical protein